MPTCSLVVSPYGASLRGLSRVLPDGSREDIITGYSGAAGKVGGQGDVLIPFPGRVAQGRYTFGGQTYQMDKNDKEGPNAIHGFLRQTLWDMRAAVAGGSDVSRPAWPPTPIPAIRSRSARASPTASATDGLECAFAIGNLGDTPAPVAAGFHPYFTLGSELIDADTLHVPFESYLEFDDALIPTGRVLPVAETPLDFRQPRPIGAVPFNTCYLHPARDPDGLARIRLTDPAAQKSLTVWLDSAFDYVVLYSGDPLPDSHRRRALAIEPMTCGSDAFNHPNGDWFRWNRARRFRERGA